MSKLDDVKAAVETGKSKQIEELVNAALGENDAMKILDTMVAAMGVVGEKFQKAELFVPEMLVAARTMKKGVDTLKPKLGAGATTAMGKCIIGTVHGDLHDIGKNLVALMIESAGFNVIDLGVDVTVDKFVDCIKANPDVKIVALSCLLTTTMPSLKEIAEAVKKTGGSFKMIAGGAPITEEFAKSVGADGHAQDAAGAAIIAKKLAS